MPTAEHDLYNSATSLFSSTYRQILEYYLEPVSLETLAMEGMRRLDSEDRHFTVAESGSSVIFLDQGREFSRLEAPSATDAEGWAQVTASAMMYGKAHAPDLAEASAADLYQRVFDGITPQLDRFSRYTGGEQARDQRAARDGFGGLGVTLDYSEAMPRISSVIADGPAARADLRIDDRLTAIDGVAITTLNQREVVERLRGPIDSHVALAMLRPGREKPFAVTVTRGLIVPPTVTADQDGPIAIFHVDGFNVSTAASLRREVMRMRALHAAELKGVVLDLRDNPGGLLDQGAGVAAVFLNHGAITSIHGRNPSATQYFDASESDETRGLPMAVLVNGGSASASEIVAAALQDDRRAVVIGSSSYGKGTVQMVLRLENDGELTLTWARLYAPDGYLLHQHGVVPVFCTSHPVDPLAPQMEAPARMQAIIDEGLHPTGIAAQARASLSDADWQALRARCPPTNSDNSMDLALAERVLLDPALYAAAISPAGVAVAHVGHAPPSVLQ